MLTWAELESKFLNLQAGGRYRPRNCTSHHRVAIIVPFRDRDIHLKIFLNNIHPLLQRQQLDYGIYIVDLVSERTFDLNPLLVWIRVVRVLVFFLTLWATFQFVFEHAGFLSDRPCTQRSLPIKVLCVLPNTLLMFKHFNVKRINRNQLDTQIV